MIGGGRGARQSGRVVVAATFDGNAVDGDAVIVVPMAMTTSAVMVVRVGAGVRVTERPRGQMHMRLAAMTPSIVISGVRVQHRQPSQKQGSGRE